MCDSIELLKLSLGVGLLGCVVPSGAYASAFLGRIRKVHPSTWRWLGILKKQSDAEEVPQAHALPGYLFGGKYKRLADVRLNALAARAKGFFLAYIAFGAALIVMELAVPATDAFSHCLGYVR